jgi:hypothetical protein
MLPYTPLHRLLFDAGAPPFLVMTSGNVSDEPICHENEEALSGTATKSVVQFPPDVDIYWFHHRCYRPKATDRYLLPSRTGIEFVDGSKLDVDGVFIELGAMGSIELALEIGIVPDPRGFIPVDAECKTEAHGVFACGDVTGMPWQLARAVGQGCIAGTNAARMVRKEE